MRYGLALFTILEQGANLGPLISLLQIEKIWLVGLQIMTLFI
jgi:hypothetical protein